MSVRFTRRAINDLASIREYIATDNPMAASRMAVEIVAACDRLEIFPERGKPGLRQGTRELTTVWPYVIVYRISGADIDILAICLVTAVAGVDLDRLPSIEGEP